eukprot:TRINITY_DN122577_c0_g1_i1.p1 TRINITY_DN122577_c0_g1~~TRINITY_DN122577_c0_g1_i1.p1  ORF type:complete len:542 (+),score=58.87 TRINITY_DN122577_c0_g1_i1:59-1684(+)
MNGRGRKRRLDDREEALPTHLCKERILDSPRLKRHVRKLLQASNSQVVVDRYRRSVEHLERKPLLRHTVHVAAWVALLPACHELLPACALLLARCLALRGKACLSVWLRATLQAVCVRLREALQGCSESDRASWQKLRVAIPRGLWRASDIAVPPRHTCSSTEVLGDAAAAETVAETPRCGSPAAHQSLVDVSFQADSATAAKRAARAARHFHDASCAFENSRHRKRLSEQLAAEAQAAFDANDAFQLCRLLLRGAAWLAAATALPICPDAVTGRTVFSQAEGDESGSAQGEVRAAVLLCLTGLDLEDPGTASRSDVSLALRHLGGLLDRVSAERLASNVQWKEIAGMILKGAPAKSGQEAAESGRLSTVTSTRAPLSWSKEEFERVRRAVEAELAESYSQSSKTGLSIASWEKVAAALGSQRSAHSLRAYYRTMTDPDYKQETNRQKCRHERGLLGRMVKKVFQRLGGAATCHEVVHCCKTDPAILNEFHGKLDRHITRVFGSKRLVPAWEGVIRTSMHKWCSKTDKKKGRVAVWVHGTG